MENAIANEETVGESNGARKAPAENRNLTAGGHELPRDWLLRIGIGLVLLIIAVRFIPNVTFSRTARRDEVVAQAMKTALAVGILSAAIPREHYFLLPAWILFCVALTIERLIFNRWFIHYSIRHSEHGVILCDEETAWQQQALKKNT